MPVAKPSLRLDCYEQGLPAKIRWAQSAVENVSSDSGIWDTFSATVLIQVNISVDFFDFFFLEGA